MIQITRLLLLAILLLATPAWAQSDPLRQAGVTAEATAADSVQARNTAHAQARRTAFNRLATAVGATAPSLSDAQIEALVASMIVEEERITNTRYAGRLTIVFNGAAARGVLGGNVPLGGGGGVNPQAGVPATNSIEALTAFASMQEWLDLRRRLLAAGPVASVDILAIAVDGARLRLGMRGPVQDATEPLARNGVVLAQAADGWRVGLGGR